MIKPALLDRVKAAEYVNLSPRSFDRYVQSQVLPKPRQLTIHRVGWLTKDLDAWAESRPVSSNLPVSNSQ